MTPGQSRQLENVINEVLKTGDIQALDIFLQRNDHDETVMKCSQQFVSKLDKLITKSLDNGDPKAADLGFVGLYKYGKNLKLYSRGQGLPGLLTHGLIDKWFEKCRQLWIQRGPRWDETLFILSEDFFSALMVVHDACKEGTYKITESFLYPVGQLAVDPRIHILIQKEAIRKFNSILDKIPLELKKDGKILTSREASDIMRKLAGHILDSGDYDFQSSLMEALCRMATYEQRRELAHQWFSMGHVASAFAQILDSEFETACRKFLNMVNGMDGDKRRVCSYPCLEVYLDKYELLMPTDEKLEEFWIDFNLGSRSISFYFSVADEEAQEGHWETISVNDNEVVSYTVTEEEKRKVLHIKMSVVVAVGSVGGSSLTIHFSSSLDILQAARKVFGHSKSKANPGEKRVMEENNTQVVPESQMSLSGSEKKATLHVWPASSAAVQMATPAKMKISESTIFISGSGGGSMHSARSLNAVPSNTPAQHKDKSSVERVQNLTHGSANAVSMKEQSTASETSINERVGKHKKNMSVSEAVALVLTGQEEEHDFVPDSQPRTGKNMYKLSISETLMLPTQKISSLFRPESRSSVREQQERRSSSTHKGSVSDSTVVCQRQFHQELTQHLQKVLDERNQVPAAQAGAAPQIQTSGISLDSKVTGSGGQCVSSVSVPKEAQGQRNGRSKEKSKRKTCLELQAFPVKASAVNTTVTEGRQERAPLMKKRGDSLTVSSREKRDSEVTGSLVKHISSHYKMEAKSIDKCSATIPQKLHLVNRPVFNMSWVTSGKKASGTFSHSKTKTNSAKQRKDVFAFSVDAPLLSGGGHKTFTDSSDRSHSGIHNSSLPQKGLLPEEKGKRYVKKNLFSDTDTDNTTTEVSWLRESSRKPKPKVTKYPRQAPVKPAAVALQTSWDSPDFLPPSTKAVKDKKKPTERKPMMTNSPDKPRKKAKPAAAAAPAAAARRPRAAGNRPKRAAAISAKSYKEPDTDDSQSETEIPPPPPPPPPQRSFADQKQPKRDESCCDVPENKKKKHVSERPADNGRKHDSSNQPGLEKTSGVKQRPRNIFQETSKLKKKTVPAAQEQKSTEKSPWAARQASRWPSPPLIERMRSGERSDPTLGLSRSPLLSPRGSPLLASPRPPRQDTPSPVPLLPKPRSAVSSTGNCLPSSFGSAVKSSSKTPSIRSVPSRHSWGGQTSGLSHLHVPSVEEKTKDQEHFSSASQSPFSLPTQPLLTSTIIELPKPAVPCPPHSPFPEDTVSCGDYHGMRNGSTRTRYSLSCSSTKSSVRTCSVKDSPAAPRTVPSKIEKTPSSELHVSGPCRKRHVALSSDSEEDEKKERKSKMREQRSPRMKPRKLFKSFTEVSTVEELSHIDYWESGTADEDLDMDEDVEPPETTVNQSNLCQQFSAELKKKLQNRCKMMEAYNKQSLKTVHQNISSINMQITKQRTQRLEQVQKVLLEEIHQLEQEDTVLRGLEKDLTVYWRKQTTTFHSYQKRETMRNESLKRALQSSECHSLEYEERIFTSQMCLMRNDMKSVQDRLLGEMQDKEIQSVKRGLHALFFP